MIQELESSVIEFMSSENKGYFIDEIMDGVEGSYTPQQFEFVISRMIKQELIRINEEEDVLYLNN